MSQAARESLALADRTQRLVRWVLVLAWVVGVAGVVVFLLAAVAAVLVLQHSSSVNSSGGVALGGVALLLLVNAALLALLARYTQLRAADVRASRAYEAAIAGALADLLRPRDLASASTTGSPAAVEPVGPAGTAASRPEPAVAAEGPVWRPHSHSAEAQPLAAVQTVPEPAVAQTTVAAPAVPEPVAASPVVYPVAASAAVVGPEVVAAPIAVSEPVAVQDPVATGLVAAQTAVAVAPATGLPVAGWYPDPAGPGQRWWDGLQWTTATR